MNMILASLTAGAVALGLLLLTGMWRLQRQLVSLQMRYQTVPELPPAIPRPVISIKILNPFELAARESRLAEPIAMLAPQIIEHIVYRRTVEILIEQLRERGVEAQVQTHHGTSHVD